MKLTAEPLTAFDDPICDATDDIEGVDPFTDPDADWSSE